MKSSVFLLSFAICAAPAWSQGTSPSTPPPSPSPSPASTTSQTPAGSAPSGQLKPRGPEAVAQQDPDRVVAIIEGKQITARQALDLLKPIPAQERKRFESNLPMLVQQMYAQRQLADEAAKLNLDQQSPWKEQLQRANEQLRLARENILTQAYLDQAAKKAGGASAQDPKQYYDAHLDDFDQFKLSGIIIGFNPPGTPAANANISRTEQEAQQKADDLEKKIKAGTDLSVLARTESDNKQSGANGGDLGTFASASIQPDLKAAVLKLQPGQISEPIRIQNVFLILRVDSRTKVPFEQARAGIVQKQEMDKYKIQVKDSDFFNASTGSAPKIPSLQRPAQAQPSQPQTKPPAQ